jgi:hypothetical protein
VETLNGIETLDCDVLGTRAVNRALRELPEGARARMQAPRGRHNLAVGLPHPIAVTVEGNAGYFLGGLGGTKDAGGPDIVVNGFVGWSVGENLMGGTIRVRGSASQGAGASARGGSILIEGDASLRAGISLKGGTIAIAGDASPSMRMDPPRALAPALCDALPRTRMVPPMRFSPTDHPTKPLTTMSGPPPSLVPPRPPRK